MAARWRLQNYTYALYADQQRLSSERTDVDRVRKLGTVVEFSVLNDPSTVNWTIVCGTEELDIRGSHLGACCYPNVIDALGTGKVNVKPLLADAYPIADVDRAMQAALSGGVIKSLVAP